MNDNKIAIARTCLEGAESGTMTFPQIVGTLMKEGFEGYAIDFRRAAATYYTADGDSIELPTHKVEVPVAVAFNDEQVTAAIREAQQLSPDTPTRASAERPLLPAARVTSSRFRAAAHSISAAPPKPTSSISRTNDTCRFTALNRFGSASSPLVP